jgi:hypothetical protein
VLFDEALPRAQGVSIGANGRFEAEVARRVDLMRTTQHRALDPSRHVPPSGALPGPEFYVYPATGAPLGGGTRH